MNLIPSRETLSTFYPEALPLLERHNTELEQGESPLKIDEQFYLNVEASGMLRIYAMRDETALDLKGYAVFLLSIDNHRDKFVARCDAFFPGVRGAGLPLLNFCDRELQAEGVERILHEVRPKAPTFAELLTYRGYIPMSQIFGKDLN